MSAALSPLEQLEQQTSKAPPQQAAQPASGLSPLEQLEQMSAKPTQQPGQGQGAFTPDADNISTGGEGSNSDQQLMSDASQRDATKKGLIIGGAGAAAVGGLAAPALVGAVAPTLVDAAGDPIVQAVVSHLGKVKAILDAAGKLGLTGGGIGFGVKEARDLYKEFSKEK